MPLRMVGSLSPANYSYDTRLVAYERCEFVPQEETRNFLD
jgi:hypothetical protein